MNMPKYDEVLYPFLEILQDGNEHRIKEIRKHCADSLNLTEEEINASFPSGGNIFKDRVGWARTYLRKAKLISSPEQTVYLITDLGREMLQKGKEAITSEYIRQLVNDNEDGGNDVMNTEQLEPTQSPQEAIENAISKLNSALADELLTEILNMDSYSFEHLVVDLLIKMGYGTLQQNDNTVTQRSRDEGIDGFVKADRLGFDSIYTQAKKWKSDSKISTPEIQKFLGALAGQGATKGLFITTGQFTQGAREFVKKQLNHKIVLIDGRDLANYMIEYGLGVTTVTTYAIKRIDSDYFVNDN